MWRRCRAATGRLALASNRTYVICPYDLMGSKDVSSDVRWLAGHVARMTQLLFAIDRLREARVAGGLGCPTEASGGSDRPTWRLRRPKGS
jgi:hypothetical protein